MDKADRKQMERRVIELEAAARECGVQEGHQMSRFLLWVGNEVYEGREVGNLMVLAARATELVQMFLQQDTGKR